MNNCPLVSVIIPAYNAEKHIIETLISIKQQTYQNIELTIVDDNSNDQTLKKVKSLNLDNIRLISLKKNLGVANSRNVGISNASGKYCAFLDSDDISHSSRITQQVKYMESHSDCVVLGSNAHVIDEKNQKIGSLNYPLIDSFLKGRLIFSCPFATSSIMLNLDKIKDGVIFQTEYEPSEDYKLWTELISYGKYANLPSQLVSYRKRDGQLSSVKQDILSLNTTRIKVALLKLLGINLSEKQKDLFLQLSVSKSLSLNNFKKCINLATYFLANNNNSSISTRSVAHQLIYRLRIASGGKEFILKNYMLFTSPLAKYIPSYIYLTTTNLTKGLLHD